MSVSYEFLMYANIFLVVALLVSNLLYWRENKKRKASNTIKNILRDSLSQTQNDLRAVNLERSRLKQKRKEVWQNLVAKVGKRIGADVDKGEANPTLWRDIGLILHETGDVFLGEESEEESFYNQQNVKEDYEHLLDTFTTVSNNSMIIPIANHLDKVEIPEEESKLMGEVDVLLNEEASNE